MFSVRNAALWMLVAAAGTAEAVTPGDQAGAEQLAVAGVSSLELCQEKNPTWGLTLEGMLSDPSFNDERKAEFRKVSSDPHYKGDIAAMRAFYLDPGIVDTLPRMCAGIRKMDKSAQQ